jgi:hypothetical protein
MKTILMICHLLGNTDSLEAQQPARSLDMETLTNREYHSTAACEKSVLRIMKVDHGSDWRMVCDCSPPGMLRPSHGGPPTRAILGPDTSVAGTGYVWPKLQSAPVVNLPPGMQRPLYTSPAARPPLRREAVLCEWNPSGWKCPKSSSDEPSPSTSSVSSAP